MFARKYCPALFFFTHSSHSTLLVLGAIIVGKEVECNLFVKPAEGTMGLT